MKVLIVDDNADILESTQVALELMDVEAVVCQRSPDILDAIRRERPDVVLQDAFMPDLDVDKLLRTLRQDPDVGAVPVLLFTANQSKLEGLDASLVQGVVEKPFELDQLMEQLEKAAG